MVIYTIIIILPEYARFYNTDVNILIYTNKDNNYSCL